jgi:dTDP-L-rhamnose 4-epimerase
VGAARPDGTPLLAVPTDEDKPLDPTSIYALTKADQERMVLQVGAAYGIPSVALRFFNIYGPRQALSNPYTGVAAIFSARLLNGEPPLIYEDGEQRATSSRCTTWCRRCCWPGERREAVGRR